MSGRLWMNSLEALATVAKEGAGIVRVPLWQIEADLAAGRLVRLLADYEPPPAPLHLMFQPSRLASPKIRAFVDYLVERWCGVDPFGHSRARQ
jgi:DNA-binding transcriptional LysR family regulator